jgi:predicted nucleotidyltransferase
VESDVRLSSRVAARFRLTALSVTREGSRFTEYSGRVDYVRAIEALIPGARGQVLSALTLDTSTRTLRQVALAAGVSWSQTALVIDDLCHLGIVERRQTPGATLIRLAPGNVVVAMLQSLTDLRSPAIDALRRAADGLAPAPLSLTLFGSFARGEARRDSDVDVVAVHRSGLGAEDSDGDRWSESLGRWVEVATSITGNQVNLIDLGDDELRTGHKPPEWLHEAAKKGVTLAGRPLAELLAEKTTRQQRA